MGLNHIDKNLLPNESISVASWLLLSNYNTVQGSSLLETVTNLSDILFFHKFYVSIVTGGLFWNACLQDGWNKSYPSKDQFDLTSYSTKAYSATATISGSAASGINKYSYKLDQILTSCKLNKVTSYYLLEIPKSLISPGWLTPSLSYTLGLINQINYALLRTL